MLLALWALAASCVPAGRVILAEVFYDAAGVDTGHEYVELFNPHEAPVSLDGLVIESGDGAGPGRWTARWAGGLADVVPPGGRFVIGGDAVVPAPDAIAELQLQNGPDAVRLMWPDGAVETVGWGAHEFPEYSCGEPAEDVPSGMTLARVPDDADRGSNALDFQAAEPSPGRPNQPALDAAMIPGTLALDPERPDPGGSARLAGFAVNRGATTIGSGAIALRVESEAAGERRVAWEGTLEAAPGPGDSVHFDVMLVDLPKGVVTIVARIALAGDEMPANDADSLRARVGPGPLELTEIQFHPSHGEGEWVEVRNRGAAAVDPATYTLSDRGTSRGRPEGGITPCAPESLAVLAQDREALLARHPDLDAARVWQVRPWSSLNNSNGAEGVADLVVLRDAEGLPSDSYGYSASGVPSGVPLERRDDGLWWPALAPEGTPLAPYRAPPSLAGAFAIAPRRLRAGGAPAELSWSLPWSRARVAVDLYDLAGARVAEPLPETDAPDRGAVRWSCDGVPPGLYVAVLRARPYGGGDVLRASSVVRIEGYAR